MATQTRPETKAKSFGENLESDLALEFLRVVENAAIASAHTMGQGERKLSDHVATEAMRLETARDVNNYLREQTRRVLPEVVS